MKNATLSMALCEGRHAIPNATNGAIFGNTINPLDVCGLEETAYNKLMGVKALNLYVTGLSVALIAVVNVCHREGIMLTLWHYDRDSGNYYPQSVA